MSHSNTNGGLLTLVTLAVGFVCTVSVCGQNKPKGPEILAKHIASIGSPESIAAAANRKLEGTAQVRRIRDARSLVQGISFLASAPNKHILIMAFEATSAEDYRGERVGFDGKKVNVPFVTASQRSATGEFIFQFPEIVKSYLFGGSLFSSWALHDAARHLGDFEAQGTEKINGVETYKVRVKPKNSSSLAIRMYFDAATFRHVRTEYKRTVTAGTVRVDEGRMTEDRYTLIEDFSDYKEINGLSLPTSYVVTFRVDTANRGREFEWVIKLSRFSFDKQLEPEIFGQIP